MILSIDPGIRSCGFAIFDHDGRLYRAGLAKNVATKGRPHDVWFSMAFCLTDHVRKVELPLGERISEVVIERPQVYVAARLKGDPNDLISLAVVVGAIGALYWQDEAIVTTYLPREWKGQVKKEVTQMRVEKRLSAEELKRVEWPAKSLAHNVFDGIGLGLFHSGRGK